MQTETAAKLRVQFTLNAADRQIVKSELARNGFTPRLQRVSLIMYLVFTLIAIGMAAYGLFFTVLFPAPHHRAFPWIPIVLMGTCWLNLLPQLILRRQMLPSTRADEVLDICFEDSGIKLLGNRIRAIPWRSINGARDLDDAIVLSDVQNNVLVVPKRVFADSGAAFWAFLEQRLIGRRGLIRRPEARRTIYNTNSGTLSGRTP